MEFPLENPVSFINNVDLFFELLCVPVSLCSVSQVSGKVPVWVSWSTRYTVIRFIWRLISYYDHILLYWSVYKTRQPCRKNNRVGNPHVHVGEPSTIFFSHIITYYPLWKYFPHWKNVEPSISQKQMNYLKRDRKESFVMAIYKMYVFGVVWISKMYTVKIKKFYLKSVHCSRS